MGQERHWRAGKQRDALRLKGEAVQRDAMVPRANRRPGPSRRRPHRGDFRLRPPRRPCGGRWSEVPAETRHHCIALRRDSPRPKQLFYQSTRSGSIASGPWGRRCPPLRRAQSRPGLRGDVAHHRSGSCHCHCADRNAVAVPHQSLGRRRRKRCQAVFLIVAHRAEELPGCQEAS